MSRPHDAAVPSLRQADLMMLPKPVRPLKEKRRLRRNSKPIARTSRPRPFRKGAKAAAKRLTKAEWSRKVRAGYDGRCVYHCYRHLATDAAHIVPVGVRPAMRFASENGLPLCREAHQFLTPRPAMWAMFAESFIGTERYGLLMKQKQATA